MSAPVPFEYGGHEFRTIDRSGEPWFVVADVCRILSIGKANDAVRGLDDDERGTDTIRTPSGDQQMLICSEAGLYSLILRSRKPEAKAFKRWVTHEVLPSIRKTGTYSVAEVSRRELAQMVIDAEDRAELEAARADKAERVVGEIEAAAGITLTQFHKHYFSSVGARAFFDHMYALGLLIDQRGSRGRDDKGRLLNGRQHRHPAAAGKPYLYLHGALDRNKERRESVRVRPGSPEVALVDLLTSKGLVPNQNRTNTLALEVAA